MTQTLTIADIFTPAAPSFSLENCINGIIFSSILAADWRASLFSSTSIASYTWLRDLLAASCDPRYKAFRAGVPVTTRLNVDFHFSHRLVSPARLMNEVMPLGDKYDNVSGVLRRYLLDNLTFTEDEEMIAKFTAELPRVMIYGNFAEWATHGDDRDKYYCLQLIRSRRNDWHDNAHATQYAAQLFHDAEHFHDYMISPEEACECDLGGVRPMFAAFRSRECRIYPLLDVERRVLLTLGVLNNVDGRGNSLLQVFANMCHRLRADDLYNVLTHILGDEDPVTTREIFTADFPAHVGTVAAVIMSAATHDVDMHDTVRGEYVKKIELLLTMPIRREYRYTKYDVHSSSGALRWRLEVGA